MKLLKISQSLLLIGFGAMSVFMTISVIFDLFGIREKEGNYVLFIVYTNLICGILYLFSVYFNWSNQKISLFLLTIASIILIAAFIALKVYAHNGGVHEEKTTNAMMFRIVFTAVMAIISYLLFNKSNQLKTT